MKYAQILSQAFLNLLMHINRYNWSEKQIEIADDDELWLELFRVNES